MYLILKNLRQYELVVAIDDSIAVVAFSVQKLIVELYLRRFLSLRFHLLLADWITLFGAQTLLKLSFPQNTFWVIVAALPERSLKLKIAGCQPRKEDVKHKARKEELQETRHQF